MLSSLAPARRRLVVGIVALVLLAALVAVGIAVAGGSSRGKAGTAPPVARSRPGPVLLLPGYGGSTTGLRVLAGRLRTSGRGVEVVSLPDNAQGDLRAQARVVASAAKAAMARAGAASVDVVGYSAGGVVARIWLKEDGGAAIARRVVTLGAPQHGTALATLGSLFQGECPTACQQLTPTSDVLAALNAGNELPAGPAVISLWSSSDEVVIPPRSAELKGALNIEIQQVCAGSTVRHGALPTDPLVSAMVAVELGGSRPTSLTARDCARLSKGA